LSDSDDNQSTENHPRSPSAHSVQSQTYSEPELSSDWLLLGDISTTRGYSSECEAWGVDDADDDIEDEGLQPNDFATLRHSGAQDCLNSSLVIVQHTDDADSIDNSQGS